MQPKAIEVRESDVNANETILTIVINDNDYPELTGKLLKTITDMDNKAKFWRMHHIRQCEEVLLEIERGTWTPPPGWVAPEF